jgi:signal transduction histidine kinase
MRTVWWRHALQHRLGSLAAAALIVWTAVTAVAASIATDRLSDLVLAERTARARDIAADIDAELDDDLRRLDLLVRSDTIAGAAGIGAVRQVGLVEAIVRVGADGRIVWTAIAPHAAAVRVLLAPYARERFRVDLLDSAQRVIASSRAVDQAAASPAADLIAQAAVFNGRWQLRIVELKAAALAPVFALRRVLVGSSLLLLPFAVVVALATARSIRRPVIDMTDAAERLGRGEFTTPIPLAGDDEIGRLSAALEQLRRVLEGDEQRSLLLKRIMAAQEEERCRIARELHDDTTQQLTVLALLLDATVTNDAGVRAALARAGSLTRATIDGLHRLMHDLRPAILDDLGLLPAIRAYAQTHLGAHGIDVHCELPPSLPQMSREATTALYRTAQEALANVARHARAETVMISCVVAGAGITIEVEDDGVGFEPARIARPRENGVGLGLLGMRERIALFGGDVTIESEPGRGTRVVARLPLASGPAEAGPYEVDDAAQEATA